MNELSSEKKELVIFDGVCNLCNAWVDFLIRHDRSGRFFFTANQSNTGEALLKSYGKSNSDIDTVYFWDGKKLYDRSAAILQIAKRLPFPWKLGYVMIIFPAFFRNWVYRQVAKNRYHWFGRKDRCRVPTDKERAKFI